MSYRYYLGPWIWDAAFPSWRPPVGTVGLVDLRSLPDQSRAGIGFFASTTPLASEYASVGDGDCREIRPPTAVLDAWQAITGYRPQGDRLVDLLFDHLTAGSDPAGDASTLPLMPTTRGELELHLAGHSRVRAERFRFGTHSHSDRIRDVLRRQFRGHINAAQTGRLLDREHHRRILDYWCKKYRVADWREFVPADLQSHVPGRLPHQTTITESFPGTSATLGGDLTWTEISDSFANDTGQATHTGGAIHYARAESDLSSDDHYAQFLQTGTFSGERAFGPCARFDPSATTCYDAYYYPLSGLRLNKVVAGTQTNLADAAVTPGATETWKVEANGSTIKSYMTGVEKSSVTDTAITGNVRGGLIGYGEVTGDDWEAADLAIVSGRVRSLVGVGGGMIGIDGILVGG